MVARHGVLSDTSHNSIVRCLPLKALRAKVGFTHCTAKSVLIFIPRCLATLVILARGYRIQERSRVGARRSGGSQGCCSAKSRAKPIVWELVLLVEEA